MRKPGKKSLSLRRVLNRLVARALNEQEVKFRTLAELAGLSPERDFVGASLRGIDFRDEDLRDFNFFKADLTGADFRRADIRGAQFEGAILLGVIGLDETRAHQDAFSPPSDFDLAVIKQMILSGEQVSERWVPFVVELSFSSDPLQDLTPMENLRCLQVLDLTKTSIRDLAPLSRLNELRELRLGDTIIEDITDIERLPRLRSLDLTNTKVSNIGGLVQAKELRSLFLIGTPVTDVRPLSGKRGLSILATSAFWERANNETFRRA